MCILQTNLALCRYHQTRFYLYNLLAHQGASEWQKNRHDVNLNRSCTTPAEANDSKIYLRIQKFFITIRLRAK